VPLESRNIRMLSYGHGISGIVCLSRFCFIVFSGAQLEDPLRLQHEKNKTEWQATSYNGRRCTAEKAITRSSEWTLVEGMANKAGNPALENRS